MSKLQDSLNRRHTVACVWDFDKTLIPGYMQKPLFERYGINETKFWREVNQLPDFYRRRGVRVSPDTVYLNHLLSYVRHGPLKGLNNRILRELGKELEFYPGLPDLFASLKRTIGDDPVYSQHDIHLEHYVISTGLAEMIRGSKIAPFADGIYGCEFVENTLPPNFLDQTDLPLETELEISQIGQMVDNTIKTRFIFEINKGSNRNAEIDVNAMVADEDRRVPIQNMIYIADGPSDIPVFSVVRRNGGKAYAVYDPDNPEEFTQNDNLLQVGRIHAYGPADYRLQSSTAQWLTLHLRRICDRIVHDREATLARKVSRPPKHLHRRLTADADDSSQSEMF